MFTSLALLGLCVTATSASNSLGLSEEYSFSTYLKEFGKEYPSPDEYTLREALFTAAVNDMLTHNKQGSSSYTKGLNQFSDMTHDEKAGYYRGYKHTRQSLQFMDSDNSVNITLKDIPDELDWRHQHATTPVKNQG